MKKTVFLFCAALAAIFTVPSIKADIIAGWNFQTAASTNALFAALGMHTTFTNIPSDIGSGFAAGAHASASTAFSSPAGNGSTNSVSANQWTVGDYYQFAASSVGYTNISISFGQVGSGTGPGNFNLQYSIDGTTYTTFTNYSLPSSVTSWSVTVSNSLSAFSFDLSSITGLANDAALAFRFVDASTVAVNGGAVGTAGSDRLDDIIIGGSLINPVPEPSTIALAAISGVACLVVFRRRR
jgi:hypothetical protein